MNGDKEKLYWVIFVLCYSKTQTAYGLFGLEHDQALEKCFCKKASSEYIPINIFDV